MPSARQVATLMVLCFDRLNTRLLRLSFLFHPSIHHIKSSQGTSRRRGSAPIVIVKAMLTRAGLKYRHRRSKVNGWNVAYRSWTLVRPGELQLLK